MANHGLRPPQFSEDSEWLPAWLQPHRFAFGEQTINSQSVSQRECKGLGRFLGGMEHTGEAGYSSSCEAVRRSICPLFLSEDGCTMTERSQSVENTVALRLCLSSEDNSEVSATKLYPRSTEETCQSDLALDNCTSVPNTDLQTLGKKSIQVASQQTPCTELYVPGIIQEGDNRNGIVCSNGACPPSFVVGSKPLAEKKCPSSACNKLADQILVPKQAVIEKMKNSLKHSGRKRKAIDNSQGELREKANSGELSMIDMDVAIELTVAAAEALVISNLVRDCRSTESLGSSEILEAALKLKQARQVCGLDSFSDVSIGHMDGIDNSWFEDLDDNAMEEAFADVGLSGVECSVSPGACFGDACKLDDARDLQPCKNLPLLSMKEEELLDDFQGRSFTLSKLGPMADSSDTEEIEQVLSSANMVPIDTSISRCLDGVKGTEDQQSYGIQNVQIPSGHAVGWSINQDIDTKSSNIGLPTVSILGNLHNSLSRNLGSEGPRATSWPVMCKKLGKDASLQSECLSMGRLVQCCSHKSANEETQSAAQMTYCNNQVGTNDEGVNHGNANENFVFPQSSMMCSPSWLNHTANRNEEMMTLGISQSSQSTEWQCQIQAAKGLNHASDTQINRNVSTDSPKPFNSRWFGGWTGLDAEMNVNKNFEATMYMPKPFVDETSYLTESLDIAIEGSTPMQGVKQPLDIYCLDPNLEINDLSSNNKEICCSFSQNSIRCSNSPSCDPLCSLVPCSIPLEDDPSTENTNLAEMNGTDPIMSRKLHSHASLQLYESPITSEKENAIQIMSGNTHMSSVGLNSNAQQTRTESFSNGDQGCIKRKQVDSLRHYSTLSKVPQIGSVKITGEIEEISPHKESIIMQDPAEMLKWSRSNADSVSGASLNEKQSTQKFAGVRFVESASACVNKDFGDLNALSENVSPSTKLSTFNYRGALNIDSGILHHLSPGKFGNLNNANSARKSWDDLGDVLEKCLDEEESPPFLLNHKKRRRLRAYRTIESSTSEESSWYKTASMCMNQSVATVSENVKHFEIGRDLSNCAVCYEHGSLEQLPTKLQGKGMDRKRVHFSDDIIKSRAGVDECQKGFPENKCTEHSKKRKVCSNVHGRTREPGGSGSVQSAEAGMKITQTDPGRTYQGKSEQKLIFQGMGFLLTGLSSKEKNELRSQIRSHGGIVLSDLPSVSHARVKGTQKTECNGSECPIVVSSQQVRTTKYLYGCAVGSLLLQPGWITDSITAECCLPYDKYQLRSITSYACRWPKLKHCNKEEESKVPLFTGMRIMLYGKPAFYSKLMVLIKHGGGQVFRTIKCLLQGNKSRQTAVAMIIVEDVSQAPRHLRQCASDYRLPVMSGNWIIESLLLGRLLPFRTNFSSGLQSPRKRGQALNSMPKQSSHLPNVSKAEAMRLSGSDNITTAYSAPFKNVKGAVSRKDNLPCHKLPTVCEQGVSTTPLAVPDLGIKLPGDYAEVCMKQKHRTNCLYYQKVGFKGVMYSIGDVVELEPPTESEVPSLARIECLWSKQAARVKTRSRKNNSMSDSSRMVFMRCRWFYHPSDTGFPCMTSGKEIYISNRFHDDVSVQKVKRKVSLVFMVDGRIFPVNAPNGKEAKPSCFIPMNHQKADFICKFFYDHENKSLHQMKYH